MSNHIPVKILGQDDWLIFGRLADDTLVYTIIETDWHWLEAPHRGECWNEKTGLNCDGETMSTCRKDAQFMQDYVKAHAREYYWRECDYDTDGSYIGWPPEKDAEFTVRAAETYLPKERLAARAAELERRVTDLESLAGWVADLDRRVIALETELDRVRLTAEQADNVAALARDKAFNHGHYQGDLY